MKDDYDFVFRKIYRPGVIDDREELGLKDMARALGCHIRTLGIWISDYKIEPVRRVKSARGKQTHFYTISQFDKVKRGRW